MGKREENLKIEGCAAGFMVGVGVLRGACGFIERLKDESSDL